MPTVIGERNIVKNETSEAVVRFFWKMKNSGEFECERPKEEVELDDHDKDAI